MTVKLDRVIYAITTDDLSLIAPNQWGVETVISEDTGILSLGYKDAAGDLHRVVCYDSLPRRKIVKSLIGIHCELTTYTLLPTDQCLVVDTDGEPDFVVHLPAGSTGAEYFVINKGLEDHVLFIVPNGSDKLLGPTNDGIAIGKGEQHLVYYPDIGWWGGFAAFPIQE